MARKRTNKRSRQGTGLTRRQFLTSTVAAGLMAGLPPGLTAWGADRERGEKATRPTERRTLFFNFAHEADAATAAYFVVLGGQRYPLLSVQKHPRLLKLVLKLVRQQNTFLRGVPDRALTHVLPNVSLPANAVHLVYVLKNPDTRTGTWSMSSMYFHLPKRAVVAAHHRYVEEFGAGPRPRSAKRRLYGHPPAVTVRDLLEETALVDPTDHAVALVGLHPELLSVELTSAGVVQHNHIAPNRLLDPLVTQLQTAGAATPQQTPAQPNPSGWATLVPVTDEHGVPLKNTTGANNKGLIHYNAEWHPQTTPLVAQAQGSVAQTVKDDEKNLGANITGVPPGGAPAGTIWHRRDGITSLDQSPRAASQAQDSFQYTLVSQTPQSGYKVSADVTDTGGKVQVTLNFENWYLRWLGLYAQFLDHNGHVVPVSQLPSGISAVPELDTATAVYLGLVTPEFTIYGIPVQDSKLQAAFTFPTQVASSAKILASGLGFGSHTFQDTEAVGIGMTTAFNLVIPTLLLGMGLAQGIDALIKTVVIPDANFLAVEIVTAELENSKDTPFLTIFWRALVRALAAPGAVPKFLSTLVPKLVAYIIGQGAADAAEDALPLVGAILQAVAALGIEAEIAETSCEVVLSPWTYENDLTLTHDLSVNITPDLKDKTTPKAANQYKVTALFDNGGTPLVQIVDLQTPLPSVPVTFTNVPLGGKVNISASFYQVPKDPTQDHVLLGKATTGLVSNDRDTLDSVNITEIKFPIGPSTKYSHSQKIILDAQGRHLWQNAPAPGTPDLSNLCNGPGTLCDFRSITVRQGTSQAPGYLGYAWEGQHRADPGPLDHLANLNTDHNAAQTGYVMAPFGLQPLGARLTYSLLTHDTANFYLDTTNGVIRQVTLGPTPVFDDPSNRRAWGKLNFTSDTLLLHPTGKVVSINNQTSKIETHQPPQAPMSDDAAAVHLLAQVHGGQGSRAGRLQGPVAAAISPEGVILILEQDNNRLQAFDTGANPVPFFTKQTEPYFLNLVATDDPDTQYLDLAVEYTGFLYVLSVNNDTNLYRLDIYHPEQSETAPISTTQNVNAAKLTVDFWRNVYTLNYELLQLPNGMVPAVTEPSVSLWVPTSS